MSEAEFLARRLDKQARSLDQLGVIAGAVLSVLAVVTVIQRLAGSNPTGAAFYGALWVLLGLTLFRGMRLAATSARLRAALVIGG